MTRPPFVLAALLTLAAPPLFAQVTPPPVAEPSPAPSPTPTPSPSPRPAFVAGYKNGFVLQSETGDFVLKITGYAQADGRFMPGTRPGR